MTDLIGKRVNIHGDIGTVIDIENGVCAIGFDNYAVRGHVFDYVIEALPEVTARASFDYRPGDRG